VEYDQAFAARSKVGKLRIGAGHMQAQYAMRSFRIQQTGNVVRHQPALPVGSEHAQRMGADEIVLDFGRVFAKGGRQVHGGFGGSG
jgi:hypothetical protein